MPLVAAELVEVVPAPITSRISKGRAAPRDVQRRTKR